MTALSTCDPGDVFASVAACKKAKVRCSVLGVAAEMQLCRTIATSTGGSYDVARDQNHLADLLMNFASPPPSLAEQTPSSLVNMVRLSLHPATSRSESAWGVCSAAVTWGLHLMYTIW